MNSITGFSVLKKPFSWKFSKHSKSSKKMKLRLNEKEDANKGYWEEGSPSPTNSTKENSQESASFSWDFNERWPSSEEDDKSSWEEDDDCVYSTPSSSPHQRSPDEDTYPLYENGDVAGMSSCVREEVEPIYESVAAPRSPVNLFLSLVGSQETISPDPNIYEVPPGAILNISGLPEDSPNNITPPNEFQDDRTVRSLEGLEQLNPKLENLYSQVNKSKRNMETVVRDVETSETEDATSAVDEGTDWDSSLTEQEEFASASESELDTSGCDDKKDPLKRNMGAHIMELYEKDKKKLVSSLDLPDVTILDVQESFQDIEKERRRIIDNQVVKKKRINSWIKENGMEQELGELDLEECEGEGIVELATDDDEECTSFQVFHDQQDIQSHISQLEIQGEIVYDSILQNKEKTKNYWEKLMLATKMAANSLKKAGMEEPAGKVESVVEREIRLQREREEALVLERQNAFKLAKYAEEGLHSIPTTDEGNYSECSEEKDQSLDSSGEQEPTFNNYQRTPSFESMSSGHSSGSDGTAKKKGAFRKSEQQPTEPNHKIQKESPIEKDIRISKEREEELKPKLKPLNFNSKQSVKKVDEIRAELESISLKKCVSMSNLPLASNSESNLTSTKPGLTSTKFRQTTTRQSPTGDTASKIFTPSKIPRGLMKRFIESHGRMPTSFVLSPPATNNTPPAPRKMNVSTEVLTPSPPPVKSQESTPLRRPGYRSAEDKIQMELKEMKRREAELKLERARLLGRSQPNLLNIGLEDLTSDDETFSLPQMGKLRSALSNPNLTNERTVIIPKRCNELIDAWENMIQKKSED